MAELAPTPSSAELTDHEDKFEDAPESELLPDSDPRPPNHNEGNSSTEKAEDRREDVKTAATHARKGTTSSTDRDSRASSGITESSEAVGRPQSPVVSAHRLSRASLTESKGAPELVETLPSQAAKSRSNSLLDQGDTTPKPPAKTSRFGTFSASLPSVPWGAATTRRPSNNNNRDPSPQPPAPALPRRNTPFGWLSRAASSVNPKSPPLPAKATADARRNTAASISTLGSNPDLMLKALDDNQDGKSNSRAPARQSLRDKFKLLRMQEEVGAGDLDDSSRKAESISGVPVDTPGPLEDKELPPPPKSPLPQSPIQDPSATINPNLAAGTVSGISAAASDVTTPIDWDFWQTVVNEGPQAVARTSPEELTAAIAGGIPQTIRGVIWQVLASSKNEDLESVYEQLKLKGTKEESRDTAALVSSSVANGSVKEKESIASSKSSVASESSTPATSANVGVGSPSPSQEQPDAMHTVKAQTELAAERARRAKADSIALTKLEKMIKRDMGTRTSYSKYTAAAGLQDGLFNVCRAYALFDDTVGYPQGMNFIIMPMLFIMTEEEAFCLLVRLMNKYQLRELFIHDMPGLHLHLYQFERLLEDLEPALFCHLNRRGVTPKLYATPWFLTLFAYRFPLQLVMRVFDLVLCEGLEGAILKFGMALVQRNSEMLLAMDDMQALTNHLKEKLFDVYIDAAPSSKSLLESGFFGSSGGTESEVYRADILVQDACAVKLTPEMLARYTTEYEDRTRTEKARETELENLRTDTATKASRIRSLEQRAEKSDAEHIEIANELVKLKVENQDLLDENESLKGQGEELRKVAASEAANTEERMRAGTEQVMQRNIEVQNENRHMEEQMAEMERELVEMKMKYAELSTEHENLRQKWSDLRKALE